LLLPESAVIRHSKKKTRPLAVNGLTSSLAFPCCCAESYRVLAFLMGTALFSDPIVLVEVVFPLLLLKGSWRRLFFLGSESAFPLSRAEKFFSSLLRKGSLSTYFPFQGEKPSLGRFELSLSRLCKYFVSFFFFFHFPYWKVESSFPLSKKCLPLPFPPS